MIVQEYPIYNKPDLDKPLSLQVITKRKQLNHCHSKLHGSEGF